jgi:energy-coupling factor transport system ATP-binding protein
MPVIEAENLTFTYGDNATHKSNTLQDITFSLEKGAVLGIIGENGSGKSTLIKHFNGILQPAKGSIKIFEKDIANKHYRRELWKRVGMVFQFPEQQLFEDTVFNEIAYGLKNLGVNKKEIANRVKYALERVGLENEHIENLSPLSLSGGIRRRVAIASVLAMRPEILIFDEVTVGLDLSGREKIINIIKRIKQQGDITIIIVSHNLSELIEVCSHIAVLNAGKLISFGKIHDVLKEKTVIDTYYDMFPDYLKLMYRLSKQYREIDINSFDLDEVEIQLDKLLWRGLKNEGI